MFNIDDYAESDFRESGKLFCFNPKLLKHECDKYLLGFKNRKSLILGNPKNKKSRIIDYNYPINE